VVAPEEPDGVELVCTWPTSRPGRSSRPAARSLGRCCRWPPTTAPGDGAAAGQGGGVRQAALKDGPWRDRRGVRRHLRQPAQPAPGL